MNEAMRRSDREVTDIDEIEEYLRRATVCRIALFDGDYPYIIPLCFGYSLNAGKLELYFHCAAQGKKLELIKKNSKAAFEIDSLNSVYAEGELACSFTASFFSITGIGSVEVINGIEKLTGLNLIMDKYANGEEFKYSEEMLNNVQILKLTAVQFSCKAKKDTH